MGRALGCLGHVSALRRTAVGPFTEKSMISLEQLELGTEMYGRLIEHFCS
jgi:tRNA U55 pseudouridine synthase TruB